MFGRWLTWLLDAQAAWAEPFGGWLQPIVQWVFRPDRYITRLSPQELLAAIDQHLRRVP